MNPLTALTYRFTTCPDRCLHRISSLLIPLVLKTDRRVCQSPHGMAAGWTELQPRPVSYGVRALLPSTCLCTPCSDDSATTSGSLDKPLSFCVLRLRSQICCPLVLGRTLNCLARGGLLETLRCLLKGHGGPVTLQVLMGVGSPESFLVLARTVVTSDC
jgi:hypothetical protein